MCCGHTDPKIIDFMMKIFTEFHLTPFQSEKVLDLSLIVSGLQLKENPCMYVAAEGASTPEEIDQIFSYLGDFRHGAFHFMDEVSLDVVYDIESHSTKSRKDIPKEPRQYLKDKFLSKNKLGVKSGSGFYQY